MLEIMEDEGERWIEIVDDKLLGFLYNISDDILKFVWKEKNIEILGKYFDEDQSNYLEEFAEGFFENIEDVGFDEIIYEVIGETKKEWLTEKFLSQNKYRNFIHISLFTCPDEIRNLDDEILWKSSELDLEDRELVENIRKKMEENFKIGKKYVSYKNELEKLEKSEINNEIIEAKKQKIIKFLEKNRKIGMEYLRYLKFS